MNNYETCSGSISSHSAFASGPKFEVRTVIHSLFFPVLFAALITLTLFLLMQYLISEEFEDKGVIETKISTIFYTPPKLISVRIKERVKKPIPPVKRPTTNVLQDPMPTELNPLATIIYEAHSQQSGPALTALEGEPIPYLRPAPQYPSRMLARGIEGYVDVRFDIAKSGKTDNVSVVQSMPVGGFDRAAVRAVSKWKYKPQIENGVAVRKSSVVTRVSFKIER